MDTMILEWCELDTNESTAPFLSINYYLWCFFVPEAFKAFYGSTIKFSCLSLSLQQLFISDFL